MIDIAMRRLDEACRVSMTRPEIRRYNRYGLCGRRSVIYNMGRGLKKVAAEFQLLPGELKLYKRSAALDEEVLGQGRRRKRAEGTYWDWKHAEDHAAVRNQRMLITGDRTYLIPRVYNARPLV
jgi:hypothetical protein